MFNKKLLLACSFSIFIATCDNSQNMITMPCKEQLTKFLKTLANDKILNLSEKQISAEKLYHMIIGSLMDKRLFSHSGHSPFIDTSLTFETFEEQAKRLCKACLQEDQQSLISFNIYLQSNNL